jgi:hypothetical protein
MVYIELEKNVIPAHDAIVSVCEKLGIPQTTGASGAGWSFYSTIQSCPRKFYFKYVEKVPFDPPRALSIGSLIQELCLDSTIHVDLT